MGSDSQRFLSSLAELGRSCPVQEWRFLLGDQSRRSILPTLTGMPDSAVCIKQKEFYWHILHTRTHSKIPERTTMKQQWMYCFKWVLPHLEESSSLTSKQPEVDHRATQTLLPSLLLQVGQSQTNLWHPAREIYIIICISGSFQSITDRYGYMKKHSTVCSDKFILTRWFPEAFASADTRLVFPTPGDPSSRTGLWSFNARKSLRAFIAVVPAPMV